MIPEDFYEQYKQNLKKTIESMKKDFTTIRTGRATPALLERIHVECYGARMPLNQIASVSIPEARMMIVQPFDRTITKEIEKAIQKSDLGINPSVDGNIIRLILPSLTEERRKELAKVVKKRQEDAKVALRNIRREALEHLKKMEKDGTISEDDLHRSQIQVQKILDEVILECDKTSEVKEKEVMEV